jgi:hypothetical protein
MLRRVALVRTDVSEELGASFIRVTEIDELGTYFLKWETKVNCADFRLSRHEHAEILP